MWSRVVRAMKPVLYVDNRSPPVRSVLLLIEALGLDVKQRQVDLFKGDQFKQEFTKLNPTHTVPVLEDGDVILTDSHVILIYLSEKYGKNTGLYPNESSFKILERLFFNGTVLFRRDSIAFSEFISGNATSESVEKHMEKFKEAYGFVEKYLQQTKFIATDEMTIADFSAVTTLSTMTLLVPIKAAEYPMLHKWFRAMSDLPYFQIANDCGRQRLKDALNERVTLIKFEE